MKISLIFISFVYVAFSEGKVKRINGNVIERHEIFPTGVTRSLAEQFEVLTPDGKNAIFNILKRTLASGKYGKDMTPEFVRAAALSFGVELTDSESLDLFKVAQQIYTVEDGEVKLRAPSSTRLTFDQTPVVAKHQFRKMEERPKESFQTAVTPTLAEQFRMLSDEGKNTIYNILKSTVASGKYGKEMTPELVRAAAFSFGVELSDSENLDLFREAQQIYFIEDGEVKIKAPPSTRLTSTQVPVATKHQFDKNRERPKASTDGPMVSTAEGVVRGRKMLVEGVEYLSFMGIPYAVTPPERFQAPKPPVPWTGVKDASEEGEPCIQQMTLLDRITGSEDCLHVSVHTPSLEATGLPVVVWVHGGAFRQGTGHSNLWGPARMIKQGVIVVSFNYRLGALGFLSTNNAAAPANNGLKDMVAALRWVRRNVHMFGGDIYNVCLYGISTGGTAVDYLTLSPMANGLFSKVISQSGSSLIQWSYTKDPLVYAFRLGKYLGITTTDVNQLIEGLRSARAEEIVVASDRLDKDENPFGKFVTFVPSNEESVPGVERFLYDSPENILKSGRFIDVPYMQGFNELEGTELVKLEGTNPKFMNGMNEIFEYVLPTRLIYNIKDPNIRRRLVKDIKRFYFGDKPVSVETVRNFIDLVGDVQFALGVHSGVKLRLKTTKYPMYYSKFSYYSKSNYFQNINYSGVEGAAHADDAALVFTLPFVNIVKADEEYERVSLRLVKFITNFAKYGNPTPRKSALFPIIWHPIRSNETLDYLEITKDMMMKQRPNDERNKFWEAVYAKTDSCY